jgi:hypothetical protein
MGGQGTGYRDESKGIHLTLTKWILANPITSAITVLGAL